MKKFIISIVMILMIGFVSACKPTVPEDKTEPEDFLTYLVNTKAAYEASESGNIYIQLIDGDEETTLEYIYNYTGSTLTSLKVVLIAGESQLQAYVKDGVAYVDVNGEKTKDTLTSGEQSEILSDYNIVALMETAINTFDLSLLKACTITTDEAGVATLDFNKESYVFISTGLSDEEFLEADERYQNINTNIEDITLEFTYTEEGVSVLDSTWTHTDSTVSSIKIEFRGTTLQTITYPTDLDDYTE
ncbi:MAG: hypothetical protein PHP41_05015 [Bacilli bacterium]|jgi:hypothetical protein|nr:hypothetical protein [Bacilli bacterium]MDY0064411.1 hypothetical protein [Bacilli bacterium]